MSEQQNVEELFRKHHGEKPPGLLGLLAFRHAEGRAVLVAGSLKGEVAVAEGRFHSGKYELQDFDCQSSSYQTLKELEDALGRLLGSLSQDRLDIFAPKTTRR